MPKIEVVIDKALPSNVVKTFDKESKRNRFWKKPNQGQKAVDVTCRRCNGQGVDPEL